MTTRKSFLAGASLLAASPALTAAAVAAPAASPAPRAGAKAPATPVFDFDEARFNAILSKDAKHKQCFGAKKLDDGGVLNGMQNSIDAYERYLHEPAGSMQTVAVLYHGTSIALALNDAMWNGTLAKLAKDAPPSLRDELKDITFGKGNPYLHPDSGDPSDVSVERIVGEGGAFFVCHNALVGFAGAVAKTLKVTLTEAHAQIMASIVPGAVVVPAGVMAINACQEARFTYIAA